MIIVNRLLLAVERFDTFSWDGRFDTLIEHFEQCFEGTNEGKFYIKQ